MAGLWFLLDRVSAIASGPGLCGEEVRRRGQRPPCGWNLTASLRQSLHTTSGARRSGNGAERDYRIFDGIGGSLRECPVAASPPLSPPQKFPQAPPTQPSRTPFACPLPPYSY